MRTTLRAWQYGQGGSLRHNNRPQLAEVNMCKSVVVHVNDPVCKVNASCGSQP